MAAFFVLAAGHCCKYGNKKWSYSPFCHPDTDDYRDMALCAGCSKAISYHVKNTNKKVVMQPIVILNEALGHVRRRAMKDLSQRSLDM